MRETHRASQLDYGRAIRFFLDPATFTYMNVIDLDQLREACRVGDDRSLDQALSVSRTEHNVAAKRGKRLPCGRLHHKEQTIEDVAQRMLGGERQVVVRIQEQIDCCRGTTPAVPQHERDSNPGL